ncbi:MAG: TSUP family transporter [Candidatus Poseidoniales archaeon]|nr:TSUP family transporter [Candidatus Poseidoniales archaeon]
MEPIVIIATILFLVVALIFSPLGLGGGVLYVPIFHYVLDWEFQESLIGSLTLVLMVALGSGLAHSKTGNADHKMANAGRISAVPSAIVGTILSGVIISFIGDTAIKLLAIIILLFVLNQTVKKMKGSDKATEEELDITPGTVRKYQYGTAFAGLSSGLLGMGGGAILVTLNRNLLKMGARKSAGTSYLIASTIVPVALFSHLLLDGVTLEIIDTTGWVPILIVPTLVAISAFSGAKFAIKNIPKKMVTNLFLGAVFIGVLRYAYDLTHHAYNLIYTI